MCEALVYRRCGLGRKKNTHSVYSEKLIETILANKFQWLFLAFPAGKYEQLRRKREEKKKRFSTLEENSEPCTVIR